MYKVCIIGCGMIAESAHLPAYRSFPDDYTVTAVFDVSGDRARNFAEKNGIPNWYTDANSMLEQEKPDVVSVCVPNKFHKEYTLTALSNGANVLCEKPLAVTYHDACEMYDLAEKKGCVLMACQSMRFTPDRLAAKRYIEKNGIGDICYAEFSRIRRRGIPYWGTFHIKEVSLGGAMCDIGVHMLDAVVWLLGCPEVVSLSGTAMQNHKYELGDAISSGILTGNISAQRSFDPEEMDVEDFASGSIKLGSGAVINFKTAWAANMPECTEIRLIGKDSGIFLPEGRVYSGKDTEKQLEVPDIPYRSPFAGHICLAENMRDVLSGKASPTVTPAETKAVSAILEMFYLSAELGREVSFDEVAKER